MQQSTCTVPGCDKPLRSSGAQWCAMHYHRWYRHGDVNRVSSASGVTVSQGRRYRSLHRPSHPLATPCGRVYEHQIVLYEAIGDGAHPCHWCRAGVRWDAIKGQPDRLYPIRLSAKAPHAAQFGPWQPNADGSEIRYRAQWPGRD